MPKFGERPDSPPPTSKRIFRYSALLHKVREYPGQWALIAVFDEGSPKHTASRINVVSGELLRYLRRDFPLEVWDVSRRTIAEHWSRREIWVCYHGEVTPEQAAEMRAARAETFKRGRINGAEKRAAQETLRRIRALAVNREIRELAAQQRRESAR